jgi:energy-converting hydrogenase Eha subunit H
MLCSSDIIDHDIFSTAYIQYLGNDLCSCYGPTISLLEVCNIIWGNFIIGHDCLLAAQVVRNNGVTGFFAVLVEKILFLKRHLWNLSSLHTFFLRHRICTQKN